MTMELQQLLMLGWTLIVIVALGLGYVIGRFGPRKGSKDG